jgi:hypothetical protein
MRQHALSLAGAVASSLRFAIVTALLAFTALLLLAQEKPIPAELSFLNKAGKPYRITYEPWTEMRMPTGNSVTAGNFPSLGPLPGSRFRSSDYEVHSVIGYGFQGQDHTACSVS